MPTATLDGNEAVASVAYRLSDVAAIYPITPSSTMGELADEWAGRGMPNLWGRIPSVTEMQSEAGAAGAVHGALQAGALATTFTASQGLLLMLPNLYKIAGELSAFAMHVAARTVATHALSIFGDHSDVMACRASGFALLAASSVQEAHDLACIAHAATLESRVPFLHFFDGFRTSHEVAKIQMLSDDALRAMIDAAAVQAHRDRALTPDRPVLRGSAQNPDVFFQAREACNPWYDACPGVVRRVMRRFGDLTGRHYHPFEYCGHAEAERVVVLMGSGVETAKETVQALVARGERVGCLQVRLYRPWDAGDFLAAVPRTVRVLAVLDRTKEPGAPGEPLYLDVATTVARARDAAPPEVAGRFPRVVGGRYGLSSKELTPAMLHGVFAELATPAPRHGFTVGIVDDVTHRSLDWDPEHDIEADDVQRAVFFGLGADGTVGANKNSIKIIGEATGHHVQGYFVYDSKKSGATTVSHLRWGPRPIRSAYLIRRAGFVACHQYALLDSMDVLSFAAPRGTLLLNAPHPADRVWEHLTRDTQQEILDLRLRVFAIDARKVADEVGLGGRINTIMQTCFFALAGVLPREAALERIEAAIVHTYEKRGEEIVRRNVAAVRAALDHLHEVRIPDAVSSTTVRRPAVAAAAPEFVQRVTAAMLAGHGDRLPVSAFAPDGTWPLGTAAWEKRDIATRIPIWDEAICIQCNKCAFVCPHAAIRAKVYEPSALAAAPAGFRSAAYRAGPFHGLSYTIQVAPEDCTGCNLCVAVCPAKDKGNPRHKAIDMQPHAEHVETERRSLDFFLALPEIDRVRVGRLDVKSSQLLQPLFEYSGACAGCGETPYLKLLTQLYGDRLLIANATGCSSIYGGNLPATPYCTNTEGRGPAWSNSLFEDNAEFGLGFRLAIDSHRRQAERLLREMAADLGDAPVGDLLAPEDRGEEATRARREHVEALRRALATSNHPRAGELHRLADWLVRKSVWLVGGDGWAYDIGYGGLDHVLALGHDVNVLVLDTGVYSNTGGQASKATPLGAAAKFAARGKEVDRKDLGLMAMSYGHVYVASIAFGAKDAHTVKVLQEADEYPGPSLVIAYSHCIAHGYDMAFGADQQLRAVQSGVWPLYRYDPRRVADGEPPLVVDAAGGKLPVQEYMKNEARFRMVEKIDAARFRGFARAAQRSAVRRMALYEHLASLRLPDGREDGS